jgi:hypothetical protein
MSRARRRRLAAPVLCLGLLASAELHADPYSLPWQLRPVALATAARLDSAIAHSGGAGAGRGGVAVASTLLGAWRVHEALAPFVRLGLVGHGAPDGSSGTSFLNPLVGVTYARPLPANLRLAVTLALALPLGTGGGNDPVSYLAAANRAGILARSALDNALFAVNDLVVVAGAGLAYLRAGFTAQLEWTLLQLNRVRGAEAQPDAFKTNSTMGLHLGYFAHRVVSLGAELRYQRWLSTPSFVASDATGASRDTLTVAVGPRLHFRVQAARWLRPGIAYVQGLDAPMATQSYRIVYLDLPFIF